MTGVQTCALPIWLAPGRYVLLTDIEDKRIEQPFELKAGERRQLTAGSP